ncbi:MAG: hypothetical protein C3F11_15030 [Methylocystaceae bacterium]|nr:MAG: hypothetical protein C3F11_15030 [Methylocystaceae bacterium]
MSLTEKLDGPSPTAACRCRPASRRFRVVGALLAIALIFVVPALCLAGYPLVAIWVALVALGWLFILGAARASRD